MASLGTRWRPSATLQDGVRSTRNALSNFPSDPEAAAVRTARNATRFRLHYTVLIWVILVATLVPRRRLSLLLLLATSTVAVSYILLLRALHNSPLLHRSIDPRLVTALLLIVTVVQLVLTGALKHLLLSLAAGVPIVLIHAVFWVTDDPAAAGAGPSPLVRKALNRVALPSDPEAAAVRVVRNATRFRLYYAVLLWVVLFATLVPRRPISLVCLLVTSEVAVSYCMLMRAFPDSAILHRFIDRRLVGALFLIVIVVELVVTRALKHLLLSMAAGVPVVLIHAVFWAEEGLLEKKEAATDEELEPIAAEKNEGGDVESGPQSSHGPSIHLASKIESSSLILI